MEVFSVFAKLRTVPEVKSFFSVLFTDREVQEMETRWAVIKAVFAGNTQRAVRDDLGVGIGTASRAAQMMKDSNNRRVVGRVLAQSERSPSRRTNRRSR